MSEAEDRISSLPCSLLHHILSFVDTRNAARTSLLSERWKYIWRSIPHLHFHYLNILRSILLNHHYQYDYFWQQADKFIDFVDKTLEVHDESNIQKFSLWTVCRNEPQIDKWITTVMGDNVEELSLVLYCINPVLMPPSLYSCESLTKLKLCVGPGICFPKYISFPRLQILELLFVEFGDQCSNEQLFASCPVLQCLILMGCTWSAMKSFCISNPALKNLVIVNRKEDDGFRNCDVKIHAPSLRYLTRIGTGAKDYVISRFPALVRAGVDFIFEEHGAMWDQEIHYGAVVSKFLRALAHVEYLEISDGTLKVLSVVDDLLKNLPSFNNLYWLGLIGKLTADKALMALLETAPNLLSIKFEGFAPLIPDEEEDDDDDSSDDGSEDNHYSEDEADAAEGDDGWVLDMVVLFSHLKFVNFKNTGNAREMRWLKLILKNAEALDTMTISCDPISYMKRENILVDISSLPRASASCVFKFCS